MIETNEPMTESREHAKPPEGDSSRPAAMRAPPRKEPSVTSATRRSRVWTKQSPPQPEGRKYQGPGCRRDRPNG